MAVEDMYKAGGLEYEKTFCNEIDGFIYKVVISFFIFFSLYWGKFYIDEKNNIKKMNLDFKDHFLIRSFQK